MLAKSISVATTLILLIAADAYGTVTTATIFSPSNNRNVSFQVYTPPGYATNTAQRYPLVISLHGIGGTSLQRANLYGPTLDARINSGAMLPMVWMFPDGQTNSFYGDAFDGHKQVYSQIVSEELPYVDANYRTIAGRDYHAMEGFSMGGFGASMLAAKRTDLFSAIVEYGGALSTWQNLVQFNNAVAVEMYNSVEANFVPYSLWDQTTLNATALKTTVDYKMIVGDADSQYQSNTRFRDKLIALGIDPHFQTLPGVTHDAGSYLNDGSGLIVLSDHFASEFKEDGDYDRDGDADSRDYVAWRSTFSSNSSLTADGNLNNAIDAADYVMWRKNSYGAAASATLPASVPEPATGMLVLVLASFEFFRIRLWRCEAASTR